MLGPAAFAGWAPNGAPAGPARRLRVGENGTVSIGYNTDAGEKLRAYADRIERLLDEIDGLKDDLKDLKAQVKSDGFNVQALTRLVAIRRNKRRADQESELLNDLLLYAHATGILLEVARPEGGEESEDRPSVLAAG